MNSRHQTLNDTKVVIDDLVYENRPLINNQSASEEQEQLIKAQR